MTSNYLGADNTIRPTNTTYCTCRKIFAKQVATLASCLPNSFLCNEVMELAYNWEGEGPRTNGKHCFEITCTGCDEVTRTPCELIRKHTCNSPFTIPFKFKRLPKHVSRLILLVGLAMSWPRYNLV